MTLVKTVDTTQDQRTLEPSELSLAREIRKGEHYPDGHRFMAVRFQQEPMGKGAVSRDKSQSWLARGWEGGTADQGAGWEGRRKKIKDYPDGQEI